MENERVKLSKEQAVAMLPDGDYIHTFAPAGGALLGADWTREELLSAFDKHQVELAGEAATAMNHGMAMFDGFGWVFIQTREAQPGRED